MFYSLFYAVLSLSTVMSLVYSLQMTSVDTMIYAVSPTLYEQSLYRNDHAEWTFNRRLLTQKLEEQLAANRAIVFEDIRIEITFYNHLSLDACDEINEPCSAVQIHVSVDYSLFVQERIYRYELLAG